MPLCGVFSNTTFNFSQNAILTSFTSCINNTTINYISSNSLYNDIAQKTDNHFKSTQEGIGSLFRWIIIIVAIVAVLIIIGLIVFLIFSSSGKSQPKDINKKRILEQELERKGLEDELNRRGLEELERREI